MGLIERGIKLKKNFIEDLRVALIAISGFEIVAIGCDFLLSGLLWLQHGWEKSFRLFIFLFLLFQIIAIYLIVKSLLVTRKKRRETVNQIVQPP